MAEDCFTYTRTVAFGECDPARVLYTPRAVDYAVEAVESWYDEIVGVSWSDLVMSYGLEATFLSMECDYLRPMIADQVIRVRIMVVDTDHDTDSDTLTISALAERGPEDQVFQVRFEMCFTDHVNRAAVPIPDKFRERIRFYQLRCTDRVPASQASRPKREALVDQGNLFPVRQAAGVPFNREKRINYGECGVSGSMYLPRIIECAVERVGEWYQSCLGITWLDQCISGRGVPFVNIRLDCLLPMKAGQTITIVVRVPRLGTASIGYQVVGYDDDGAPCFVARMSGCYITEQDGGFTVLPFPEEMRGRILDYQKDCQEKAI